MKLYYNSYEEYCETLQHCETKIINGWDFTRMPDEVIEAVSPYKDYESLFEDIEKSEWSEKFRCYIFHGLRTRIYGCPNTKQLFAWIENGRDPDGFQQMPLVRVC